MDEVLFKAHTVKTKAVKCFRVKCREAVLAVDARKSELAVSDSKGVAFFGDFCLLLVYS